MIPKKENTERPDYGPDDDYDPNSYNPFVAFSLLLLVCIYSPSTYPLIPITDVGWSTSTLILIVITAAFVAALASGLAVFSYMKKRQSNLFTDKEFRLCKPFQEDMEEVARHTEGVGEIDNHLKTPTQVTDTAQVTGRPVLHGSNSIIYLPVPGDQ